MHHSAQLHAFKAIEVDEYGSGVSGQASELPKLKIDRVSIKSL